MSVLYFVPPTSRCEISQGYQNPSRRQAIQKRIRAFALVKARCRHDVESRSSSDHTRSTHNALNHPATLAPGQTPAREFIHKIRAGSRSLEELLTEALSELCKVKPEGLDAVR